MMESSQSAGFNYPVNYSESEAANGTSVENGTDSEIVEVASKEQHVMDNSVPQFSAEEDRLWNIVKANSLDFNAWTALIEETEKVAENDVMKIRKVYDVFLAEFPLCYGYWKKYADHEARFGSVEKVVEIYERAVQGVTYSVDIWLHYCIFAINTYGDPDNVRRLFERGLAYVGTDYLSFSLWDKYIEYEYMQQEWGRLATIYTQILENPNQQLDRYFNSFKELAGSRPLSELRTADEAAAADKLTEARDEEHGVEVQSGDYEQPFKSESAGSTEQEELEKYIAIREEMYNKAKEFESKIIGFETAIRRPYFHVRPLNLAELENWHNYLDLIEQEGDFSKVVKLYERCLIACATYREYWIRYVLCMEASGSIDLANNALIRATQIFVKRRPEIHLFAARFKEQNGDIQGARAAYELVHTEIAPGLLEAIIRHANMEHRLGKLEDAFSVYEQAIAIERGKEHSQSLPLLYAQYSRFLRLACNNVEKAKEIMDDAVEHVKLSKPFIEAVIQFESIQSSPKQIDYVESLVHKFIEPNQENLNLGSAAEREELSSIFLEYLNLFGDIKSIKKAEDRHARLFSPHKSSTESTKRHAEDFLVSDRAKVAKSYTGITSSPQSMMGAYPSGQSQWALNQQAWPPVAQAQGQHWTSSYTQPSSYSSYPGYGGGYPNSQVPTSIPESAAHASYPPTYPVQQPFLAPSDAQAAAAAAAAAAPAALATAQQASAAPQAYYAAY